MNTPSLLLSQAVEVPETTALQYWTAAALIVLVAAGLLIYWYRSQYTGLDESNRQHKAAITRSKHAQDAATLRIPAGTNPREFVDDLRTRLEAAMRGDLAAGDDYTTVRAAVAELYTAVESEASTHFDRVPRLSLIGFQVAAAIAVTGAVAVSTDAIVALLGYQPGTGINASVGRDFLTTLSDLTLRVVTAGETTVTAFPFAGTLWTLAYTLWILATQWLYERWLFVAALIATTASGIAYLDTTTTDQPDPLYESVWTPATTAASSLVFVWVLGVAFAVLGDLGGIPTVGATIGFLAAIVYTTYFTARGIKGYVARLRRRARTHPSDPWPVTTYLIARPVLMTAVGFALPLIPIYVGVIVLQGKLGAILTAYLTAALTVQLAVAAVAASLIAAVAYVGRDAWPDLRAAFVEVATRQRVRAAVMGRGLPYAFVAVGYVATYAITNSILVGALVGAVAGITAWALYGQFRAAQERTQWLFTESTRDRTVLVEVFAPTDADDTRHLVVRLGGRVELAYDTVAAAVEDLPERIRAVQDGEHDEVESSLPAWYARDLQNHGFTSRDQTEDRLRERVRSVALSALRENGRTMDKGTLTDRLDEYPTPLWEDWRQDWRAQSIIREDDGYIQLYRDPYKLS